MTRDEAIARALELEQEREAYVSRILELESKLLNLAPRDLDEINRKYRERLRAQAA